MVVDGNGISGRPAANGDVERVTWITGRWVDRYRETASLRGESAILTISEGRAYTQIHTDEN